MFVSNGNYEYEKMSILEDMKIENRRKNYFRKVWME